MPTQTTAEALTEAVNAEIRAGLARRRLAQKDLAAKLELTQSQVSARLAGTIDWRLLELAGVANLMEISLSQLVSDAVYAQGISA